MATDISRNDGTSAAGEAMIPASFAEKSMSSLLRLHGELSEEKERRIDLYRRLMEREQAFAELAGYVRLLETELARRGLDPVAAIREPLRAASGPVVTAARGAPGPAAQAPLRPEPQLAPEPRPAADVSRVSSSLESGPAAASTVGQPVPVSSGRPSRAPASSREQPAPPPIERQRPAAPGRTGPAEGWKSW